MEFLKLLFWGYKPEIKKEQSDISNQEIELDELYQEIFIYFNDGSKLEFKKIFNKIVDDNIRPPYIYTDQMHLNYTDNWCLLINVDNKEYLFPIHSIKYIQDNLAVPTGQKIKVKQKRLNNSK